jgi:colicin import membrane protein
MDLPVSKETILGRKKYKMSSIIINSFFRALTSIDEFEGIKNLTVKQLTTLLVDRLYPEDGVLTWEDDKTLKIKFNGKVPVEEETHAVEVSIPVAEPTPEPEVKEIKVKEVKPKLTKEQKAAEKAEKEAKAAEAKAAKAAEAKAAKETKAAKPKAAKAKPSAEPVVAEPVVAEPVAEPKAAKPKVAKAKFVGNLEKLNPTQDKLWKKVAAESKVELTDDHKKRFLAHINELDNTEYNTKKLETWMSEFFTPKEEVKTAEVEMYVVEYNGKEYFVDNNEDVYETVPGTDVEKKVGKVGMAYFKDMVMPE